MEEPLPQENQPVEKPKKSCLKRFLITSLILILIVGLIFTATQVIKKINTQAGSSSDKPAGPARNYVYPAPTQATLNRQIDCNKDLRMYRANPKNVLCLNLYRTSPNDIKEKMAGKSYDNIVLYGQNIFFDVATNIEKSSDFPERIYNVAKFTDAIALPKLMSLYGVGNLKYINKDYSPYPAIYYEVRNQADVNKGCSSQFNVGGCSIFQFLVILHEDSIKGKDQISKYYSWSRNETDDHLYYRQTVPIDCYTSYVVLHETAHSLIYAREHTVVGMSMAGNTNKTPKWFNEEQAGMMEITGFEPVCGTGIITDVEGSFTKKVQNANFLKFQSVYPSNFLAGGFTSNDCQKAILTAFYRYLSQGNLESRMPPLMTEIREKSKIKGYLDNDKNFANLILRFLNNDPKQKEFLNSKGCAI